MTDIMEDLTLPPPAMTLDLETDEHYRQLDEEFWPVFNPKRLTPLGSIINTREEGGGRDFFYYSSTFTPAQHTPDHTNATEYPWWSQEGQRFQPEEMARVAKEEADAKARRLEAMTDDERSIVTLASIAKCQARNKYLLEYKVWMAGQVAEWRIHDNTMEGEKRENVPTLQEEKPDGNDEDVLAFTDEQAAEFLESIRADRLAQETDFECFEVMTPDQTQYPEAQEVPPVDAPQWTHLDFLLTEQQKELVERVQERKRRENILHTGLEVYRMLTNYELHGIPCCIKDTAEKYIQDKRINPIFWEELNRLQIQLSPPSRLPSTTHSPSWT